jgi:hypothetical protein
MENFVAIRNGLFEHIAAGKLAPFDLGIYVFLIAKADWGTGIYLGCALTIAFQFGDAKIKEHVQKSLRRLRDRQYINYRNGDGKRGAYPILINKYEPTVGELCGTRLDAWKNGDLVRPEYGSKNSGGTVVAQSRNSGGTVVAPIQDLKTLQDIQDKSERASSLPRAKVKRAFQMPEDLTPKDSHRKLAIELGVDLASEFEVFKDHHLGHGSKFVDWDRALNKWLRNAREFRRGGKIASVKMPTGNVVDYHRELLEGRIR